MYAAATAECDVGEHSDVYGIGCLIYHMTMGIPIHDSFKHEPRDEIPNKVRVLLCLLRELFAVSCDSLPSGFMVSCKVK